MPLDLPDDEEAFLKAIKRIDWQPYESFQGKPSEVPKLVKAYLEAPSDEDKSDRLQEILECGSHEHLVYSVSAVIAPILMWLYRHADTKNISVLAWVGCLAWDAGPGSETYRAIAQHHGEILEAAGHKRKPVRAAAAYALAAYPKQAKRAAPVILAAANKEKDEAALSSQVLALGTLLSPSPKNARAVYGLWSDSRRKLVRYAGALAVSQLAGARLPEGVLEVFANPAQCMELEARLPFGWSDIYRYQECLFDVGPKVVKPLIAKMHQRWDKVRRRSEDMVFDEQLDVLVESVLCSAFDIRSEGDSLPGRFRKLSPTARKVLKALLHNPIGQGDDIRGMLEIESIRLAAKASNIPATTPRLIQYIKR